MGYFLLYVIQILLLEYDYAHCAATFAASQSQSSCALAPTPDRFQDTFSSGAARCVWHPATSSFQGFGLPGLGSFRDVATDLGGRLALHSMLEDQQGKYSKMCQMRYQVDTRQRSVLCAAEINSGMAKESPQGHKAIFMELCRLGYRAVLERFDLASRTSRWPWPTPWSDAKRQDTQEGDETERGDLQCTSSRTSLALSIYGGNYSSQHRRGAQCGDRELGALGHCAQGGEHSCPSTGTTHSCREFLSRANDQRSQECSRQDGQGKKEIQRCSDSATELAHQLAQVHCGLLGTLDKLRGKVCEGRPGPGGQGEGCAREVAANQGHSRVRKECVGGARHGGHHRDHGRRDGGQARFSRSDPEQHHTHGGELAEHPTKGGSGNGGSRREQAEEAQDRRTSRRLHWRKGFACIGAFCAARQADLIEACPGLGLGSPAVLLNWSHSILEEETYMSPWRASIEGLDLAWEVGTFLTSTRSSSTLPTFLRPKRSRRLDIAVNFNEWQEVLVGAEDSDCFLCWKLPMGPLAKFQNLQEFIEESNTGQTADNFESDEVSWMATGTLPQTHVPRPFLQHEGHAVVDDQAAVQQELPFHVAHHGIDDDVEVEVAVTEESSSDTDRSDSAVQRRAVIVYSADADPMHCRPRWASYEQLHSDLAHHMRLSTHDVTLFHHVRATPEDLRLARVHAFISQKPQDITEGSTFQLVLLDVEFHNALPSLEPEKVRRVKILPKTVSRKALLALLGLQPYCKYARHVCFLWHNDQLVGAQTRAHLELRHGDYLRVAVPPARGILRQFYTRDVVQCFCRGYQASNIPAVLEAYPEGIDVADMPLIDNFNYVPNAEDLDYDRDAMSLLQIDGPSCPSLDAWPEFFSRPIDADKERSVACKVAEDDHREGATLEVPLVPEEPGGRPELTFGDLARFLHDLQHLWEVFAAAEIEDEGRILYVNTWYSDHVRFPHCAQPRPVRLGADPWNWPDQIAEAWDDRVDPDALIEIHLIQPTPSGHGSGAEGVPHVVLVQHANPALRSVHVFVIDAAASGTTARAFVDVIPERVTKQDFYDRLGIGDVGMVSSLIDCMISHGDFDLQYHDVYPTRHGFNFLVIMNHLRDIITRAAAASGASSSSSGVHLLQIGANKRSISLAELISEAPLAETPQKDAVRVVWACAPGPHPSFIEIDQEATESEILLELQSWGLDCRIVDCRERGEIICFPSLGLPPDVFHYVLVNLDCNDDGQAILHSSSSRMRTRDLMEFLYALGFWRAVIVSSDEIHPGIYKIGFQDQQVVIEPPNPRERGVPQWPPQQRRTQAMQPHYHGCRQFDSQQLIDIGITEQDVRDLFLSHTDTLMTDLPQDVPQELADAVAACDQNIANKNLDRLVIYTDGSSLSCHKHLPPQRAEAEGHGDTWAMVILGERYDPPSLQFLGWCAHPVIYDEEHNMHLGAQRLGADVAEREGLCWAALGRLSQNWRVATCFRSDSKMALGQAEGLLGSIQQDDIFKFLRGAFQANEAALGADGVAYSHVPGHAGECWNELCDWLAKRERTRSFFCRRPKLDMRKWRKAIGHVWMLFGQHPDLPKFCGQGLHAPAPQLPTLTPSKRPEDGHSQSTLRFSPGKFAISACSANVNSLSRGPDGHEGKISYLREQFKTLKLNFLGIQEAKTQEICTLVDQVYRLASGCAGRHQGVELWINLAQPYCWVDGHPRFFMKNDFQIAYKDPRVLLVRTDTRYWNGWLLVAYAPHSGLSRLDREEWWRHLTEVVHRRKRHEPLIVMIDANAAPGQEDGQAVFGSGGSTSASTDLLRMFVAEHELCMPCTTTAHQGSTSTWTDPTGRSSYCIDYVLLSPELASACNLSRVVTEFDLGHGHWDHEAVAVQLAWKDSVVQDENKKKGGSSFDPAQLTSQICIEVLDAHEPADWEVDIETQVENFNAHVHHELHRHCPKRRNQPKKAYITDELWQLRSEKLALKERLREVGRRARDERLVSFFKSWASAKNHGNQIDAERFHHYEVFSALFPAAPYGDLPTHSSETQRWATTFQEEADPAEV